MLKPSQELRRRKKRLHVHFHDHDSIDYLVNGELYFTLEECLRRKVVAGTGRAHENRDGPTKLFADLRGP